MNLQFSQRFSHVPPASQQNQSVSVSACYRSMFLLLLSLSPGADAAKQVQAVHASLPKAPRMHWQFSFNSVLHLYVVISPRMEEISTWWLLWMQ